MASFTVTTYTAIQCTSACVTPQKWSKLLQSSPLLHNNPALSAFQKCWAPAESSGGVSPSRPRIHSLASGLEAQFLLPAAAPCPVPELPGRHIAASLNHTLYCTSNCDHAQRCRTWLQWKEIPSTGSKPWSITKCDLTSPGFITIC